MNTTHVKCLLCVAILTLLNSCVAITPHLVRRDADGLRREVNGYYKEEILRNAIAEYYKEPYVHVDITQLNSTLATSLASTDGGSHQSLSTTGAITRLWQWNLTPGLTNTVNINSTPVIYDAGLRKLYQKFADPRKTKGNVHPIERSLQKPAPGTYIVDGLLQPTRDFLFYGSEDQYYYWIPKEYHDEFFELCMNIMTRKNPQPANSSTKTPTPVVNVGR